jgi:hypothetical protein
MGSSRWLRMARTVSTTMLFKVLSIDFDFTTDTDCSPTLEEQQDIVNSVMSGDWDAEDDDDLIDSITDETGWCVNAITFVNLVN